MIISGQPSAPARLSTLPVQDTFVQSQTSESEGQG